MQGPIFRGNDNVAGPLHPSLVEEYPRGLSEQWLSELLPLPAGVYGVRVLPGPHWLSSGFAGDSEGSFGVVRPATASELQQWAGDAWDGGGDNPCPHCPRHCRAHHNVGGWHPVRSAAVDWLIPEGGFAAFYKAGDEGDYDLYFHPGDLAFPGAGFDAEALGRSCDEFERFYAALSGDPELGQRISGCEAVNLADRALRWLGSGASLQEVGESIFEYLEGDALVPRQLGRRVHRVVPGLVTAAPAA